MAQELRSEFSSICRKVGGTPEFEEYRDWTSHYSIHFNCSSAERFPSPKKFIELMKKASDLSEKIPEGSDIKFFFSVGKDIFKTYITGRVEYDPEVRGKFGYIPEERRYSIWFGETAPYGYRERMIELKKELNALLRGERGWDYICRVDTDPPYTVSLECKMIYSTHRGQEKPDFDKIYAVVRRLRDISEREFKPIKVGGRTVLIE